MGRGGGVYLVYGLIEEKEEKEEEGEGGRGNTLYLHQQLKEFQNENTRKNMMGPSTAAEERRSRWGEE